ncbi:hypothetical protein [Burkholderia stagnalis]|uniref:hypothetical protein n=1 Tax=Burkholderia stagnalis TaxID=1503054 RepID=UPI000F5FC097
MSKAYAFSHHSRNILGSIAAASSELFSRNCLKVGHNCYASSDFVRIGFVWPSEAAAFRGELLNVRFYAAPTGILFALKTGLHSRDLPIEMGRCWWWLRYWDAAGGAELHARVAAYEAARGTPDQLLASRRQFTVDPCC